MSLSAPLRGPPRGAKTDVDRDVVEITFQPGGGRWMLHVDRITAATPLLLDVSWRRGRPVKASGVTGQGADHRRTLGTGRRPARAACSSSRSASSPSAGFHNVSVRYIAAEVRSHPPPYLLPLGLQGRAARRGSTPAATPAGESAVGGRRTPSTRSWSLPRLPRRHNRLYVFTTHASIPPRHAALRPRQWLPRRRGRARACPRSARLSAGEDVTDVRVRTRLRPRDAHTAGCSSRTSCSRSPAWRSTTAGAAGAEFLAAVRRVLAHGPEDVRHGPAAGLG